MQKTIKKVWNMVTNILLAIIVVITILLVGPKLAGLQVFTVLSGSMEPTYHTGSLIYVKKVDTTNVQPGQAITFMLNEDTVATHRVVERVPDEEDPTVIRYRTKGDANATEDGGLVHYKNVIGTPVFTIPKLGYLATYIQSTRGTYVALAIGALVIVLNLLPSIIWGEDDKDSQKEKKHLKHSKKSCSNGF